MTESLVTIVVVTFNSGDVLRECLASIEFHAPSSRTIVVDNASSDDTAEIARSFSKVELIESATNDGFSKANNRALNATVTDWALVLNPDARLTATTIPNLLAAAERHPKSVAFGPKTTFKDGRPQVSFGPDLTLISEYGQGKLVKGVKSGIPGALETFRAMSADEKEVDWVSGSCMLIRMKEARAIGFFDERYFLYEEDADLCLRLRNAGGKVLFVPAALVIHELGSSMAKASQRSRDAYDESHRLYYRIHRSAFERIALGLVLTMRRLLGAP